MSIWSTTDLLCIQNIAFFERYSGCRDCGASISMHEFFQEEIFALLRDQCKFIESVGSATVSHKQADKFISPSHLTPGFGGLPANTSWLDYSKLVIEVGVSQNWGAKSGLDQKARKWFDSLNTHGLQYILCVRIAKARDVQTAAAHTAL